MAIETENSPKVVYNRTLIKSGINVEEISDTLIIYKVNYIIKMIESGQFANTRADIVRYCNSIIDYPLILNDDEKNPYDTWSESITDQLKDFNSFIKDPIAKTIIEAMTNNIYIDSPLQNKILTMESVKIEENNFGHLELILPDEESKITRDSLCAIFQSLINAEIYPDNTSKSIIANHLVITNPNFKEKKLIDGLRTKGHWDNLASPRSLKSALQYLKDAIELLESHYRYISPE